MLNNEKIFQMLSSELSISTKQIQNVIALLEDGNTVPFIARYRKEQTGALNEVEIRNISERWQYIQNLEKRKEEVIRLIEEQGKLTESLRNEILAAEKLQQVEDLYRPYRQKRRTKATIAKERGLEPLAKWIYSLPLAGSIEEEAEKYINEEKEIHTVEDALSGAKDIIAEWISDDPNYRQWIREQTLKEGMVVSTCKDEEKDEKKVFEMYYQYEEPIKKIVPHRVLALNRGEKEGILRVAIEPPTEQIVAYLKKKVVSDQRTIAADILIETLEDAYRRLIQPSIEREIRKELTEKAEDQAIRVFSENLRKLLLQPPLKGTIVLGIDPAYRTGCKLAAVDETGKVLYIDVIYPHPPKNEIEKSKQKLIDIIQRFQIEVIAIGNGTASRETEQFVADVIKELKEDIYYLIVNEAGASVYSASDLAREEFPDLEVEERSAVSIARRLQDPLAELVKIDPKSIGVGQYQHDVSQKKLHDSLTFVVETVVNQVGVNVNTASPSLLQYVSGLSKTVAHNIVKRREEIGKFVNRNDLKSIPRLGEKTYEQCIGFLRILDGDDPLDRTSIHPESYEDARKLLSSLSLTVDDIGTELLKDKIRSLNIQETSKALHIGEYTLKDICDALMRPERDPRDEVPKPLLKKDVLQLEDLKEGMELQGTVRNVVDFGVFVDIGVKQDGLVHISKLSKQYVKHPLDVVSVGDIVTVWVEKVDVDKGRVALTMVK
ncbi:MAG: RNA-binding transcriptional accessory protein [Bacillaceae bacterium]|jgi:protein Tex|uniref:Tex family protein n=1 Tax=Aeribacillus composti TaxID=1868734 RepID=A0ABY9WBI0_9BACI|nr:MULTISPECIES: Tex family protein [Aeribacillus]REJ15629.1 MAG: RNA-binding transcriptional accessory protein [Bacillaceae bacterium]KZM57401.1 RNA-binding transcriptional accessory protein [Aeribacillus pallidus]MDR9793506.1 Tex family protein [Aeribacillus pallidus]MED0650301.1 Tex family protein [Aeribacillus composti]MED0701167.1 Tex family protein [Aeribacillus composti]